MSALLFGKKLLLGYLMSRFSLSPYSSIEHYRMDQMKDSLV